jgi:hypothetical protein
MTPNVLQTVRPSFGHARYASFPSVLLHSRPSDRMTSHTTSIKTTADTRFEPYRIGTGQLLTLPVEDTIIEDDERLEIVMKFAHGFR